MDEDPDRAARRRLLQHRTLSQAEEASLIRRAQEAPTEAERNDARNQLICMNLRWIYNIARSAAAGTDHVFVDDLLQEAVLAADTAVQAFELWRGTRFTTYLTPHVRKACQRAVHQAEQLVWVPEYKRQRVRQLWSQIEEARKSGRFDHEPLDGIDQPTQCAHTALMGHRDLDAPLGGDGDEEHGTLADLISGRDISGTEIDHETTDLTGRLRAAFRVAKISTQQLRILIRYYGLFGYRRWTLERLGACEGLTKERIRQKRNAGIRTLKHVLAMKP